MSVEVTAAVARTVPYSGCTIDMTGHTAHIGLSIGYNSLRVVRA